MNLARALDGTCSARLPSRLWQPKVDFQARSGLVLFSASRVWVSRFFLHFFSSVSEAAGKGLVLGPWARSNASAATGLACPAASVSAGRRGSVRTCLCSSRCVQDPRPKAGQVDEAGRRRPRCFGSHLPVHVLRSDEVYLLAEEQIGRDRDRSALAGALRS